MEWKVQNSLPLADLRDLVWKKKKVCARIGCRHKATDVHHLDGNHSNNEPSNLAPACKLCHDAESGITPVFNDLKLLTREFYAIQESRKALASRVLAYERLGIEIPYSSKALPDIQIMEKKVEAHIKALVKTLPFYKAWLKKVKGVGPILSAHFMSVMLTPSRFSSVSSVWSYFGYSVVDGKAPRKERGKEANWSQEGKVVAFKIASSMIRTGKGNNSLGRQLYEGYRRYYEERDPGSPKWQIHKRALRRVSKDFVRCAYIAWREMLGLEVSQAREGTFPLPDDWVTGSLQTELSVQAKMIMKPIRNAPDS